jgi:hypothetical protein
MNMRACTTPSFPLVSLKFLTCVCVILVFLPLASAADITLEAELGDTLNLHGDLYSGSVVYLFLTGPGLPENGVVLTDISQRADQGHFTMVDVGSDQKWAYKWKTSRIENEIDPGTYIVYVTNEPVDKAHLGGSSSYKTLEVYLQKSTTSRVSVDSSNSYTLNPEEHVSVVEVPTLVMITPTPTLTTPPTTLPTPLPTTLPPTTKAGLQPGIALLGVILGACAAIVLKKSE